MKIIIPVICPLILTLLGVANFATSTPAQAESIPDPGLNAAIRAALHKPNGPLTQQDLLSLTNLNAESRNISNLQGLEAAHNLTVLDLRSNHLPNVSFSSGLTNLTFLDLSLNPLTNLVLSADMTNLGALVLQGNQLTNLTLSPTLTKLATLLLDANPLATFVLSEPMAATNLAITVASLRNRGVSVFTYSPTVQLVRSRPLIGAFQFGITGPPGVYTVLESSDLAAWSVLGARTNPLGSINFTDVTAHFSPRKFYRALLQSPPPNMAFIPPNTFTMGSPANELDRDTDEGPQTTVTLSRGFWIGKYEVTQAEYLAVMNTNPSVFPGNLSCPVSRVSWLDASNYCAKLTERELVAGRISVGSQYRLPTEAEWECAARAGTSTRFSYGDDPAYASLTNYAWFAPNANLTVHPVGQKLPNPWGLYDMEGNVWEWCQDWFGPLLGGVQTDPTGASSSPGGLKVMRGGAYDFSGSDCRSARRGFFAVNPFLTDSDLGFRVVLVTGP